MRMKIKMKPHRKKYPSVHIETFKEEVVLTRKVPKKTLITLKRVELFSNSTLC